MNSRFLIISFLALSIGASAQWTTSGTNIYNSNAGNVGVGTTTPQTVMQVFAGSGGVGNGLSIYGTNGTSPKLFLAGDNANTFAATLAYNSGSGNLDVTPRSGYHTLFTSGDVLLNGGLSFRNQGYSVEILKSQTGPYPNNTGFLFRTEKGGAGGSSVKVDALKLFHEGQAEFASDVSLNGGLSFRNQGYSVEILKSQTGPYPNNTGFLFRTEKGGAGGSSVKVDALKLFHEGQAEFVSDVSLNGDILLNGGLSFRNQGYSVEILKSQTGSNPNNTGFLFRTEKGGAGGSSVKVDAMSINHLGNVGIGTTAPDAKLAVNGTIHSKEVKVDMTNWPDHVFQDSYQLRPLSEVQQFISENHHLPEVPSEKEVLANGQNLGEMNAILLKKIEELTLYVIEQKMYYEQLKKEHNASVQELTKKITDLTLLVDGMKHEVHFNSRKNFRKNITE